MISIVFVVALTSFKKMVKDVTEKMLAVQNQKLLQVGDIIVSRKIDAI